MYLIVGATGSLGGRVAKELLGRGERVRAVARPESPLRGTGRFTDPSELESLGAELVEADLRQPESLEPHLTGVTAVAMTASGTKRMPPDTGEAVDFEGAAALAAAAERAGVRHLVYLSARGTGPDAPPFLYPKWQGENAIRQAGIPASFVRPALFMEDWIGLLIGAQLQGGGKVQLVGERDPVKAFVSEGDVAKLVTALLLDQPPSGARQVDYSTAAATYAEVIDRLADHSGVPLTVERIAEGQQVTTVPEAIAPTVTRLLTFASHVPEDTLVTRDVSERYGIEPHSIDDFLKRLVGAVAA